VTNNGFVMNSFAFPPVTTSKIRILVHNARAHFSRIVEVEATGCDAQP
jgi:hypothetical protein